MWFSLRMHKESREGFEKSSLQPLKQHSTSQKSSSRLTQRQLKVDASSLKPREVVDKALSSSPFVGWQQFKAKFQTLDVQTYNRCYLKALKKGREQNPNCTTIKKGLIYAEIRRVLKVGEIGGNATEAVTKGGHQEEASEEQESGGSKTGDTAGQKTDKPDQEKKSLPNQPEKQRKGRSGVKHTCSKCGHQFSYLGALVTHHTNVHSNSYQCETCGKHFKSAKTLSQHKAKEVHRCHVCDRIFVSALALQKHNRDTHVTLLCGKCPFKGNLKELKIHCHNNHRKRQRSYGGARCEICNETFIDLSNFRRHNALEHFDEEAEIAAHGGKGADTDGEEGKGADTDGEEGGKEQAPESGKEPEIAAEKAVGQGPPTTHLPLPAAQPNTGLSHPPYFQPPQPSFPMFSPFPYPAPPANAGFYIGHQLSSQPCESHKSAYDILRENNIKEKEEMIRSLGLENVNWKESKKVGQSKKGKKKK